MAYVEKFDGSTDITVSLIKTGDKVEGHFLGTKQIPGEYGTGYLHMFKTEEGTVGVWGKTDLNRKMTPDLLGMKCLVVMTGMVAPKKKGRKPSYGFSVKYDVDDKVTKEALYTAPPEIDVVDDDSFDVDQIESSAKTKAFLNNKR